MHKFLFGTTVLSLALLAACSGDSTEATKTAQPAMAWTDPVLRTVDKDGVKVDIFEEGTGTEAKEFDQVSVHYTGWIKNTENVFDSSTFSGRPISFALGTKSVISGWEKGILGMKVGTRARLHIPWKYGYGEQGNSMGGIPGKADLVFDVELVKVR